MNPMTAHEIMMETKNLTFRYEDESAALSDVSVTFKTGCVTAVLGGNGAGKSTLFLNLNGVLKPQSGAIYYRGERVSTPADIKALRKQVGIVFQDPNDQLFSSDVRNDIAFGALNLGLSNEEALKEVEHYAALTGVTPLLDKPTHALSFGQKKRVAIAGVLIMKPEVIILDEPTAGLDPMGVSEILHLLLSIKKETGITLILSTHDIDLVPLYCDYAYVMSSGRIATQGSPRALFQNADRLRSLGLRSPRITHLMEILKREDQMPVDLSASTISEARRAIKLLVGKP